MAAGAESVPITLQRHTGSSGEQEVGPQVLKPKGWPSAILPKGSLARTKSATSQGPSA